MENIVRKWIYPEKEELDSQKMNIQVRDGDTFHIVRILKGQRSSFKNPFRKSKGREEVLPQESQVTSPDRTLYFSS